MDKKKIIWFFIAILLAVLSISAVLSQADSLSLHDLKEIVLSADKKLVVMSIFAMLGFICCEGGALLCLLHSVGYKRNAIQGFLFSAGDVFFSAITPSASGGQPASAYFMKKSGIPLSVTTAVLVMNLVMYTLGILTVGLLCLVTAPEIFFHFNLLSRGLILLGSFVLVLFAIFFLLLLFHRQILNILVHKTAYLLSKLRLLRKPKAWIAKYEKRIEAYHESVGQMAGSKMALVGAYLWNLAQRVSQISVTAFVFLATGGDPKDVFPIWTIQSMVAIGSNTVPVPGGMGVADYLMLDGFRDMMSKSSAVRLELLSRSLSFYICVLLSGFTVAIGYAAYYFILSRKRS